LRAGMSRGGMSRAVTGSTFGSRNYVKSEMLVWGGYS